MSRFGVIPASIFDSDLSPQDIALVALLSTYADNSGYCYPSYETMAEKLNRSKGWISQRINVLESKNFLEITKRSGGKYGFRILYDSVQPTELFVQPANSAVQPAKLNNTNNNKYIFKKLMPIPDDFKPTARMLTYITTNRPDLNPQIFTRNFITRCQAKGYLYKNWDAAWRNWVNNEKVTTNGKGKKAKPELDEISEAFSAGSNLATTISGDNDA